MAAPSKQYGLIFPKKTQQKTLVKHAVFMDDSDEESSVGESLQREALKKQAMKQTKLEIQRALAEDATVYEYDKIYEDIQQKKAESNSSLLAGKGEKKPKYIQNILKAAELRKKEQEKRMEKKIQKEREMEGGAFDDKEAFVTSAYKKKLQERAEEEERERREAAVEACLDVTKQKDLSGFYRHLLNQAVGEEEAPLCSLRGARLKEEPLVNLSSCKEMKKSQEGGGRSQRLAQEKDNPDADSDLDAESSGDESRAEGQAPSGSGGQRESRPSQTDQRRETPKHPKGRRESRSSSEERRPHPKGPTSGPEKEDSANRKEKGGHPRERDSERRHRERGKEERSRPEDHHHRRHEEAEEKEEERQKKKDRKERDDYRRELRKQKDKEDKYLEWEQQEREEQRNHGGRDKGAREGKHRRPVSPGQDGHQAQGRKAGKDGLPDSEQPPELKDKILREGTEQEGKPPAPAQNKFAKRSSQESITSARDRYLARQMARVGSKPYVEEED